MDDKNRFLIKHSRFNQIGWPKRSFFYVNPYPNKKYFEFFNNHAKDKYTFRSTAAIAANPTTASQLDVWGATIATNFLFS